MPTRVEKLQNRKDRVVEKANDKINRQKYGGRTAKVKRKRVARIDKKIVKTKARVAKRAVKKATRVTKRAVKKTANVLKRARKASSKYKSVTANPNSSKGKIKRVTNRLNKLGKKAGGDKVMYPSMSYMDTFPKKKK